MTTTPYGAGTLQRGGTSHELPTRPIQWRGAIAPRTHHTRSEPLPGSSRDDGHQLVYPVRRRASRDMDRPARHAAYDLWPLRLLYESPVWQSRPACPAHGAIYLPGVPGMKNGRPKIDTVSVWCPECGEVWTDSPSGSTMLSCEDDLHPGQIVFCQDCRQPFRLPIIIGKLGQLIKGKFNR